MNTQKIPLKTTAARFLEAIRNLISSQVGWKAKLMFSGIAALLCGANGLNVVNSYVGRNFMTAIADRDQSEFVRQALFYVGVFAASTVAAVIIRFTEERLGLLWREFLTKHAVTLYLKDGTYYRLDASGELAYPDQRIAEDVRAFTVSTLSFVLMALNSSFTVVAFSGVLWTISPPLFVVAVLYAACGSYLTILLGRPLIALNSNQLDKEASFRSDLIHVRENAEAIMVAQREGGQTLRLFHRLDDLVGNFRRITAINRNMSFFTTGYNWMIQIIPALIIAPAFFKGEIAFGVITQSAAAFATLVAAFSLIVTQFQSLSNFAAVIARLSSMVEAIEQSGTATGPVVEIADANSGLTYESLTLLSSTNDSHLLKNLSISIPIGARILITGSNETARVTLFRATAGVSVAGEGRIIRPSAKDIVFVAQRPYFPPGTLREILGATTLAGASDAQILGVLQKLNLDQVMKRAGGLDLEQDWGTFLSLQEQQLLAVAHVLLSVPRFTFLDRPETALGSALVRPILLMLAENSIAYIVNGNADGSLDLYDAVLDCTTDGGWTWTEGVDRRGSRGGYS